MTARVRWMTFSMLAALGLLTAGWSLVDSARAEETRASQAIPTGSIDFVRDIRPIFENNCYKCHDAAKHKGGLRLDSKLTAYIGGDSGEKSIVPHDPDHSKLIQLVRGDDPNAVMPPKGDRLSKQQVDLLVRWVKQGAAWPDGIDKPAQALTHWSFNKPKRPPIPQVKHPEWVRNPIDAFVLAGLEKEGLEPSPEADRYTLARRLYLDLIGLPPTPEQVDEFVNDKSPDAYEKLVDRLQANPHYGERWARPWMDLARYADSAGYGSDPLRFVTWRWRDWLINAINKNLPYDQFTIQQIAGDLLPHPTTDQLIATAFNRNTMTNTEGGTDPEEFRVAAVKDRVDTTIQVWMGLTMGCAQCHSHKYDPITNREYYQLFAIFNQTEDANRQDEAPTIETPTKDQLKEISNLKSHISAEQAKLKDASHWALQEAQWENSLPKRERQWTVINPIAATSLRGTTFTKLYDGSLLASGPRPATDTYVITARPELKGITAFRIEVLPDATLPHGGPGRADDGGLVLSDLKVTLTPDASLPMRGRYVRIELPGKEKILSLAEVQVFHGDQDIARKGKATQSTTDFDGKAELAIDGNTDGDFKNHSVTHTAKSTNPWWEVDLGGANPIDRIVIWNRTDSNLLSRLSNFRVRVLDEKRETVWESQVAAAPSPSVPLDTTGPRAIALKDASDSLHDAAGAAGSANRAIEHRMNERAGWAATPSGRVQSAIFVTHNDLTVGSATLTFTIAQNQPNASIGRLRISATTMPRPFRAMPSAVAEALARLPEDRTPEQKSAVFDYFRETAPQLQPQREAIAKLEKELSGIKIPRTAIMRELPPDKRREDHILIKGNFLNKGAVVEPAVLAAFNPLPKGAPANRLGLAQWIVDKDNPLTARVEVNRLWAQLFGVGIVETQEDFGTQGTPPSNQALLDWMAVEFMNPSSAEARPWDMKRMVKTIVMSSTYRQTSAVTPEMVAKDPRDRLLSHAPRRRLEAELVRDEALSLSGLISLKIGGPSVYPPQPDGLWQAAFNGERTYPTSTGPDKYRRGIYVFWRRTVPYPSMSAFDAPTREVCTLRRIQTSTPLQAFVTLNDPVYVECSQALARRILKEGGSNEESRAAYGLRLCLCKPAEPEQIRRIIELHDRELDRYRNDLKAAKTLATDPLGPLPDGTDVADMAAWTVCSNVLLNLDGVLSKR